ncbi:hypothetical protein PG911_09310 [Tenacibaculum ovolyticum]|uniref:hypothetical protein n=1 Tax=Tenacibaculum ovolyticum TaxID=104270 RepID=UPI0022F37F26|nr:hypothetical protein [Tenacibaculum ovolyticum]WBX78444.1 hypothetical protein PG911_09310 [Tenacibaculum ovolyticum]
MKLIYVLSISLLLFSCGQSKEGETMTEAKSIEMIKELQEKGLEKYNECIKCTQKLMTELAKCKADGGKDCDKEYSKNWIAQCASKCKV